MNANDIQQFQVRLEQMMQGLKANEAALNEAAQPVELDQTRMGRLSRVDAIQSRALAADAVRGNTERQEQVVAALARIAAGSYGRCLACGAWIALERLEFDPTLTLCITCARQTATQRR